MKKINLENKTILITGSSGFIGSFLCKRLLNEVDGIRVIGLDNMNDYYDVRIKDYRVNELSSFDKYTFIKGDLSDTSLMNKIFSVLPAK